MSWLLEAVLGAILIGIFVGFFKIAAYKGYNSLATLTFCFLSSGVIAILLFHNYFALTSPGVIACAAVWGLAFAGMSALQMYALRFIDVGVLSPLTSVGNLALIVVLSFLFLREHISALAWVGIVCTIFIVAGLQDKRQNSKKDPVQKNIYKKVLFFCAGIIFLNVGYNFFIKYEILHYSIQAIQIYQYFFAAFATLIFAYFSKEGISMSFKRNISPELKWGAILGTLSAFGGYLFYLSIEHGPFVIVSTINALYIVFAVITAAIAFKEKLTLKRIILVLLSVAAVILMQM